MIEIGITVLYMVSIVLIAVSPTCDRILANQAETERLRARSRPK